MAYHWFVFLIVSTVLSIALYALTDPFQSMGALFTRFIQNNICFVAVMVCMTPIFLLDTVKLSNRFVGPIFRLHRAMRDWNQGRGAETLKFRPDDYWSGLAEEFNLLMSRQQASASQAETGDDGQEPRELAVAVVGEDEDG
jgi:hypothetical protein